MTRVEVIGNATLHLGDCLEVLRTLADNSIDSIVTDPPYGLAFMGKRWDYDVPSVEIWAECLRVLKPGGHLLAFAGTRTQHRMAVRIEDAGFEIRDMIAWVYGSGFPKSLNVSKAIDEAAGAEREVVGQGRSGKTAIWDCSAAKGDWDITAPATEDAKNWNGWGTALKPALEPITVARKPFRGTVAENVLAHSTGALNIDGCRVASDEPKPSIARRQGAINHLSTRSAAEAQAEGKMESRQSPEAFRAERPGEALGRWPANLIHDGSDEVLAAFPNDGKASAARFFYCAKASKRDREEGLEHMEAVHRPNGNKWTDQDYRVARGEHQPGAEPGPRKNIHPTVKPTDLMRYLCRLVTPPGGIVLDHFMGSGSTGKAAMLEGFRFIGIEREPNYFDIACRRIEDAQ